MATTIEDALAVLLDPALEPIVELVLLRDGDAIEAHAVDGRVRFTPAGEVLSVQGRNPLGDQAADRFAGTGAERANRFPKRTQNSYPFAYASAAQVWDHPDAPDLVVLHTASHHWADQGGHVGEHGSMGVVQARAPFILAGRGVRALGRVPRACRLVDVAPTALALLGAEPLRRTDGEVLDDLLDPAERPEHLVGILFDGCNPNVLYDMAERGEAPNVARLMAMGTTFEHGAMASLPTVTLANHTTVLTGLHPGHHGILHNAWWDRAGRRQVITNSAETWASAMTFAAPGTDSIHAAVRRTWPGSTTASVNEPADLGASFSTFDCMRRGVRMGFPRSPELPHATERFVRPHKEYAWATRVDHHGVEQARGVLSGSYLGETYDLPRFLWCNFTLTDAAFHEGGPRSEVAEASVRDTDARLGEVLAALERTGRFDRMAFLLVADHGMEESDPSCTGDWGVALREAGLDVRDEAYGFLYLNP